MQTSRVLKSRTFWFSTAAGISCLTTAAYLYPKSVKQIPLQMLPSVDKLITMDQVKEILYQNQLSKTCGVVKRMDINSVASNDPTEDEHSEHSFKHGAIIGIYDGHGGPECSSLYSSLIRLSKYLASYVANEIKNGEGERSNVIKNGLKQAFIKLDHDIVNGCLSTLPNSWSMFSRPNYDQIYKSLRQSLSGSCAILAVIEDEDIYVANVGDCRAVIGRKVSDKDGGVYNAIELSEDQTGKNPREFSRLCNEHPGEEATLIVRGRVLGGLMPTRAFGYFV